MLILLLMLPFCVQESLAFHTYLLPEDVPQPSVPFKTLYEMKESQMVAAGGMSKLFRACIEEEMGGGGLGPTRHLFLRMRRFIMKFLRPRHNAVWRYLSFISSSGSLYDVFLDNAWRLLWYALNNIDVNYNFSPHNPYAHDDRDYTFVSIYCNSSSIGSSHDTDYAGYCWYPSDISSSKINIYDTLMYFNLILCNHDTFGRTYLCPDQCLGVWDKAKKVKKPGNPCESVNDTSTPRCFPLTVWPSFMKYFWDQFEDREASFKNTGKGGDFDWFLFDTSYTCDCKEGYGWNADELKCDKHMAHYEDKCDPITLRPCARPGAKACKTDRFNGNVECTCNSRYTGSFCETLRDPCLERSINFTRMTDKGPISVLANGNDMCMINMSGLATVTEGGEAAQGVFDDTDDSNPMIFARPRHSTCVGKLGTQNYFCRCQPPFAEDLTIEYPNCLLQKSPCDAKLCLHGTCVTTANSKGKAVCMCYPGYDGPHCESSADMWTNWSECKPPCGRGRIRSRSRREYINDEDHPANGQNRRIVQEEECPPRLGDDCPISLLKHGSASRDDASYRFMDAIADIDGPFLQLQAFVAMTILLLIFIIQYLRFLTYMFK